MNIKRLSALGVVLFGSMLTGSTIYRYYSKERQRKNDYVDKTNSYIKSLEEYVSSLKKCIKSYEALDEASKALMENQEKRIHLLQEYVWGLESYLLIQPRSTIS